MWDWLIVSEVGTLDGMEWFACLARDVRVRWKKDDAQSSKIREEKPVRYHCALYSF